MSDSEFHIHRRPAVRVGGQRQRNRLSRVPRSNTTSMLNPAGNDTGGLGGVDTGGDYGAQAGARVVQRQEGAGGLNASQSMMNFCKCILFLESPTFAFSVSSRLTQSKRAPSYNNFKSIDADRSRYSHWRP